MKNIEIIEKELVAVEEKATLSNGIITKKVTEYHSKVKFWGLDEDAILDQVGEQITLLQKELNLYNIELFPVNVGDILVKIEGQIIPLKFLPTETQKSLLVKSIRNLTVSYTNSFVADTDGYTISGDMLIDGKIIKIGSKDWYIMSKDDIRLKMYINSQIRSTGRIYHFGFYFSDEMRFKKTFKSLKELNEYAG